MDADIRFLLRLHGTSDAFHHSHGIRTLQGAQMKVKCQECERVFNLADPTDAELYGYGHDCEV